MSRRSPWDGQECRPAADRWQPHQPTPLGLQPLFIRAAYSRSVSIDSRMNLNCFRAFRVAEPKKKLHDAQCRRCLMKRSIRIAENVAHSDSFSVACSGSRSSSLASSARSGASTHDCNELRRLTKIPEGFFDAFALAGRARLGVKSHEATFFSGC